VSRGIEGDVRIFCFQCFPKIQDGSITGVAAAFHQLKGIAGAIDIAIPVARHMVSVRVRNKGILGIGPAVIESNVKIREQNTVISRFGDVH
jgi:hypothetical protein